MTGALAWQVTPILIKENIIVFLRGDRTGIARVPPSCVCVCFPLVRGCVVSALLFSRASLPWNSHRTMQLSPVSQQGLQDNASVIASSGISGSSSNFDKEKW